MSHHYVITSNAASYLWQCSKCHKTRPYPSEIDSSECPGAPCLCWYDRSMCSLHGFDARSKPRTFKPLIKGYRGMRGWGWIATAELEPGNPMSSYQTVFSCWEDAIQWALQPHARQL